MIETVYITEVFEIENQIHTFKAHTEVIHLEELVFWIDLN